MSILDDIWFNPEKERQKEEERQKEIKLAEEKLADKVMLLLGDDIPDRSIFSKTVFVFVKYDFVKLPRRDTKILKEVCLQNSTNNAHKHIG